MISEIQKRDSQLQKSRDTLEKRVEERTRELEESLSVLNATLDSTADGLLVVNKSGERIVAFNEKFVEMWKLDRALVQQRDSRKLIGSVMDQIKQPEPFVQKIKDLYAEVETHSFDILEFKDGRIFERYSQPHRIAGQVVGRVWSFRDITERKRAEQRLLTQHEVTLVLSEALSLRSGREMPYQMRKRPVSGLRDTVRKGWKHLSCSESTIGFGIEASRLG